jgi:hypothetical protein
MDANDREVAGGQLIPAAFFFAMRSCEYSEVQGQRMTTVVGIDDIRFRVNDEQVRTDDRASSDVPAPCRSHSDDKRTGATGWS